MMKRAATQKTLLTDKRVERES